MAKKRAFNVTTGLARAVRHAAADYRADIALIDVGPNLGALNRSALLAADYVLVPVAPDVFSLKGLTNVGRGLADWKKGWASRMREAPRSSEPWPAGAMEPLGYVVSRFSIYAGERATHFRSWINKVPSVFHSDVLGTIEPFVTPIDADPMRLAWLKDYRSLMPMAHTVKKPIFKLKPGDGAIGGHQKAVQDSYGDFEALVRTIADRVGLGIPS